LKKYPNLYFTIVLILVVILAAPILADISYVSLESYFQSSQEQIEEIDTLSDIDMQKLATVSIPFIKNIGQVDERILYYANIFSGQVIVTETDIFYTLDSDEKRL